MGELVNRWVPAHNSGDGASGPDYIVRIAAPTSP